VNNWGIRMARQLSLTEWQRRYPGTKAYRRMEGVTELRRKCPHCKKWHWTNSKVGLHLECVGLLSSSNARSTVKKFGAMIVLGRGRLQCPVCRDVVLISTLKGWKQRDPAHRLHKRDCTCKWATLSRLRRFLDKGKKSGSLIYLGEYRWGVYGGQTSLLGKYQCAGRSHFDPREVWLPVAQIASNNIKSCSNGCHLTKPIEGAISDIVKRTKNGAKHREFPFRLSMAKAVAIVKLPCKFCGGRDLVQDMKRTDAVRGPRVVGYVNSVGNQTFFSKFVPGRPSIALSGIDRLDNSKGYVSGNVVPCCSVCNHAKHNLASDRYIEHCKAVARHNSLRSRNVRKKASR
jgi:hypothetical protein